MNDEAIAPEVPAAEDAPMAQPVDTQETPNAPPEPPKASPEEEPKPRRNSAQRRIDQLTRQRNEYREEAERLRNSINDRPKPEDYEDPDEFEAARTIHAVRQARADEAAERAEHIETQVSEEVKADFQRRAAVTRASKPDFDVVVSSAPVSQQVAGIIAEMENGPDVAYHLGKNPDVAQDISSMSVTQSAIELGKIAMRLSQPVQQNVTTSAPEPIAPVTDGGGPPTKDLGEMSYHEHVAWKKAKGLR